MFLPVLVKKHTSFHVLPNALCHGFPNTAKWESSLGIYSSCLMSEVFPLGLLSLAATKQRGRSSAAPLPSATSAADKILKPSIPRHEWAIKTMCQKWKLFHHNFSQFFLTKAKQVSWIHISYNLIHYGSGPGGSAGNYLSLRRAFESALLVNNPSPSSSRYFFLDTILSVSKGRHALQHFIFFLINLQIQQWLSTLGLPWAIISPSPKLFWEVRNSQQRLCHRTVPEMW